MVKIYKFYEKELLWKMFGSSMGALTFALIYFSLERSILKTLTGIVSSFWIVILFSTLVSFVILMIAVRNQKSSLYYEFIIEQKLIPRLINKKQREKDKIKKAKYGIMIEYLGLGISANEKDKLEAKKRINEIRLSSIPCSEKKKLKLKKEIKEIEIELTEDASEKIKLSEEIEALEELLLQ